MQYPNKITRRDALKNHRRRAPASSPHHGLRWLKKKTDSASIPTSDEIEKVLWSKILAAWYPRCLDVDHGGFHEELRPRLVAQADSLEVSRSFQGRMTWVPAHMATVYERDRPQQRVYCAHGLEFLQRGMWDPKFGGFFDQVAPPGGPDPTVQPVKQMYSTAFGIYAAAAAYQATKNPNARKLAQDAFVWIEQHAHDGEFGGYYEHLARDASLWR